MSKTPEAIYRTERLGDVKKRNLWVGWMQDATAGLNDDDLVETTTAVYPWGNYLVEIYAA
jgi:hypothetical protein